MNTTVNNYYQALSHLGKYLEKKGQPYEFLLGIKHLKEDTRPHHLPSEKEYRAILKERIEYKPFRGKSCDFLNDVYTTFGWFLLDSGCRFDEGRTLLMKDLDLPNCRGILRKSKSRVRTVYFSKETTLMIQEMVALIEEEFPKKDPNDLVFTNGANHLLHSGEFNSAMKARAAKIGIDKWIHAHLFRHVYANEQYLAGNDLAAVASLLGNKDVQTVYDTYLGISDPMREQAAHRHPRLAKSADPLQILKNFKEYIGRYHIEENINFSRKFRICLIKLIFDEQNRLHGG